ncbi:MAG TPA: DUF4446 family protein [Candidatus Paceibacterota bacterium]|nr:DUF4446 family protein [Candidatus Paceibacterota bacterium]
MNFSGTDYLPFVVLGLALVVAVLIAWIIRLELRLKRMLRGKNAKSLEETITGVIRDLNFLKEYRKDSLGYLEAIEGRIKKSVQAIETLRFNPFKGVGEGGNQSFATALINENGDGVVISTLHARDRMSLFAKPVKNFSSEHDLTEEETHVIEQAKKSLSH